MKIAFLSLKDMRTDFWSGTPQAMVAALERQGAQVRSMGAVDRGALLWPRLKHHFYRRVAGRTYLQGRDCAVLRVFGQEIARELADFPQADFVLTPFTATIAFLNTTKPVVLWHDATFASLVDFYPGYDRSVLCQETLNSGHEAERQALKRADVLLYTSDWAAQSAIQDYQADPAKIRVVPYGANLTGLPSQELVADSILKRSEAPCRFLFVGGEWVRKGGNIAFEIIQQLNCQGVRADLHVVGAKPEGSAAESPLVHSHGRLNRTSVADMKVLRELFQSATFFLLPSSSDCTPIVFAEANAFGLPVLSTRTGGIPSVIQDGINGQLFGRQNMVESACQYVRALLTNRSVYHDLCRSSYNQYTSRLNWDSSARQLLGLVSRLVQTRMQSSAISCEPAGLTRLSAIPAQCA